MSTSTKPYLVRALYEWCLDNGYTPYITVWVNEYTRVPAQYVQNEHITLSISPTATKDLSIDNEWVNFHARFGGVAQELWIPVGHIVGVFAKETGEGMGFEIEPFVGEAGDNPNAPSVADQPAPSLESAQKKGLKLVK
ncbi:ClpXP protease specificity-enhancing factor [Alysiella crassa]|uniref:Stringent starvation protein B homolog n=1 Tax=Alysiella crassa TaxID=153491 RepID=A0A376BUH1_9NEIS|nr:ClpXP protease specificity-enhancing factor [Alysiella crassa]UOP06103.1 ClpXP protease specificity-enhancing factor [Alysiella crassa]SSY80569.1 Stringent starvation protein B homolog [Alysiella crassa]